MGFRPKNLLRLALWAALLFLPRQARAQKHACVPAYDIYCYCEPNDDLGNRRMTINSPVPCADQFWDDGIPASTATQASLASAVATANAINGDKIQRSVDGLGSSQADSLKLSNEVSSTGANHAATVGALFCAQGANQALLDPRKSSDDFKNCEDSFASANAMKAMAEKNGRKAPLTPDPVVMEQEEAKLTLKDFSKNFGIDGDDYMSRMLGSGGSKGELADMLKSKLTDEQIAAAMPAAEKTESQELSKLTVVLPGKGRTNLPDANLRDKLRKSLQKSFDFRKTASAPSPQPRESEKSLAEPEHLEPLPEGNMFASKDEEPKELTLFDVVHLRYRKIWGRVGR